MTSRRPIRLAPARVAPGARRARRGAALIEALVALLIVAFGVLGFIGLQARTAVSGVEGYQRAQALQLVQDISQRMAVNRVGARNGYYLRDGVGVGATCATPAPPSSVPAGSPAFDAAAFDLANADICAWHTLIRDAMGQPGAQLAQVRGCITDPNGTGDYQVALVWQGVQATGPSPLACGRGDSANFPDENLRRGVSTVVRIGSLS